MADDGNAGTLSPAVAALDLDNNTSSAAAAAAAAASSAHDFFPINNLPTDLLVTIVALAAEQMDIGKRPWDSPKGPTWIRHSFPLVCKLWNAIFATKDASPLHETLRVDFRWEVKLAREAARASSSSVLDEEEAEAWASSSSDLDEEEVEARASKEPGSRRRYPVLHASRVIQWAQQRAESVRELLVEYYGRYASLEDFSAEEFGMLVSIVGPHLEEILLHSGRETLVSRPFLDSLRDADIPSGKLRSLKLVSTPHRATSSPCRSSRAASRSWPSLPKCPATPTPHRPACRTSQSPCSLSRSYRSSICGVTPASHRSPPGFQASKKCADEGRHGLRRRVEVARTPLPRLQRPFCRSTPRRSTCCSKGTLACVN